MAKTERRRRERAARHSAASTQERNKGDVKQPTEQQWEVYDRDLAGLVDVETDDPFVDLDNLCPTSLHIVLRLNEFHASLLKAQTHTVVRALQAVFELCVYAAALRNTRQNLDFWKRFFASDVMCRSFPPGHPIISSTARYMKAHGVSLIIDIARTRLHHPILKHIETILTAPQTQYAHITGNAWTSTPVLGLCFADCHLTAADLERIGKLITSRGDTTDAFDPEMLCLVDLSGNKLGTREWETLATYLSSPSARRISELKLGGVFTTDDAELSSVAYREAFGRTITALVTARNDEETSTSVALSLADNENIDTTLMQTLRQVFERATRPIAALSFAGCSMESSHGWQQLGRLLFTPVRTIDDCRLDISRLSNYRTVVTEIRASLVDMVNEAIPRVIDEGIQPQVPVRCRLQSTTTFTSTRTGQPIDVELAQLEWCTIIRLFGNMFEIRVPDVHVGAITCVVPIADVVALMIGESHVIRFGFTSIIFDGDASLPCQYGVIMPPWRPAQDVQSLESLFELVGSGIVRFSMRHVGEHFGLSDALEHCLQLHTVNFCDSPIVSSEDTVWSSIGVDIASNLQSLNVTSAISGPALRDWPPLKLRNLVIKDTWLSAHALNLLQGLLKDTPALVHVELDNESVIEVTDDKNLFTKIRREIDQCVQDECISPRAKLAFLSVLDVHEQAGNVTETLNQAVITRIFDLAGRSTQRQIYWTSKNET